ncbi:MAG: riboflavin synthase [bacterium]
MFTGIIEETGTIKKIETQSSGKRFTITAKRVLEDLSVEDSISVSGVCLTVVARTPDGFQATAVPETLNTSILGEIKSGTEVNLERALGSRDRFGGHFVYGHVDGIGKISSRKDRGENWILEIEVPEHLEKYMIKKGSVAVDGISLTIADIIHNRISISIIPYTLQHTTIINKKQGEKVNLETDIVGKYIEKLMKKEDYRTNTDTKLLDFLNKK